METTLSLGKFQSIRVFLILTNCVSVSKGLHKGLDKNFGIIMSKRIRQKGKQFFNFFIYFSYKFTIFRIKFLKLLNHWNKTPIIYLGLPPINYSKLGGGHFKVLSLILIDRKSVHRSKRQVFKRFPDHIYSLL